VTGRAASLSTDRPYGLARVCRALEIPRSTVYAARRRRQAPAVARKRGPKTAWTDAELSEHIRSVLAASPFVGEGYRTVWARLRAAGIRTSKPRVLRLCARPACWSRQRTTPLDRALRDRRGPVRGAPRLQGSLQPRVAHRAPRPPHTGRRPDRTLSQ
jgi:hypothetical protein